MSKIKTFLWNENIKDSTVSGIYILLFGGIPTVLFIVLPKVSGIPFAEYFGYNLFSVTVGTLSINSTSLLFIDRKNHLQAKKSQ